MAQNKRRNNQVFQIEARGTMYALTSTDVEAEEIALKERELLKKRRLRGVANLEFETRVFQQKKAALNTPEWEQATQRIGTLGTMKDELLNEIFFLEGYIEAQRKLVSMLQGMKQNEEG